MKKSTYQLCLACAFLYCLATTTPIQAQVTSDATLSTDVTTEDNRNFSINGGNRAGGNLFHSFRDFSVPTGGSAIFNNALDVQNIISRVTGSSTSNIDGLIQANGSANLFLLNPNGIIFGRDAKLDIGGSFIASTANRLNFADGNFFSATEPQTAPLLTVSVPVGLQFGQSVGIIRNQSQAGLEVQPNKTLALVGGDLFLEGGTLLTLGGRVELGSVAANSLVSLTPIAEAWALGYEGVQNFQNIEIMSQARIETSGNSGERNGDVQLRGKQIVIADGSQVGGANDGANPGGNLALKASESVEVTSGSFLNTVAFSSKAAGEINIETKGLLVLDGSAISASTENDGQGGNLSVNAPESVEVDGNGKITQLTTQTFKSGNAGNVEVKTGKLILRNGGQINSSTESSGNGGNMFIDAPESVEVTGTGILEFESPPVFPSGLLSTTRGEEATGNGGSLKINTEQLVIRDGAIVSVSSQKTGDAGNLEVTAKSIRLNNGGKLLSTSTLGNGGGNIRLNNQDLLLLGGKSEISTTAGGSGIGGNIKIDTDLLIGTGNSDITANAFEGKGGFIQITSQGVFGLAVREQLTENSDITAFSQNSSLNGVVELNRANIDPNANLVVLPAQIIDISGLIASGCSASGDNLAKGMSELVVTGRGGLPPTPTEATKSDTTLVDLGTPIQAGENRARAEMPSNTTSSGSTTLVEAQG
jgi:filamentous hemagglutinin family protein